MEQKELELVAIHEHLYTYLMKRRECDPSLLFSMRKRNDQKRLAQGYWFIGNGNYLQVPFWSGTDGIRKIANIAFVVIWREGAWRSLVNFSCKEQDELDGFLGPLAASLGGFTKTQEHLWEKSYEGTDIIANLEAFLLHDRPMIHRAVIKSKQKHILPISKRVFREDLQTVLHYRDRAEELSGSELQETPADPVQAPEVITGRGESPKQAENSRGSSLPEGQVCFAEGERGVSYDTLFGEYLRGAVNIFITDPYIRSHEQIMNLMAFFETLARYKDQQTDVAVHLVTVRDDLYQIKQQELFEQMVEAAVHAGMYFTWEFKDAHAVHARHIVLDNGWKILLDRGLDIFRPRRGSGYSLADRLQEGKQCKPFEITYIRRYA
ncbi:MAG: hypothetical protein K9M84_04450 [Spirochaetia bacterium]|nr:hypothetical protein [Spirochaetia bacterium]